MSSVEVFHLESGQVQVRIVVETEKGRGHAVATMTKGEAAALVSALECEDGLILYTGGVQEAQVRAERGKMYIHV